jgi:hypothetical protein
MIGCVLWRAIAQVRKTDMRFRLGNPLGGEREGMAMVERCVRRDGESVVGQIELSELLKESSPMDIEERWGTVGTRHCGKGAIEAVDGRRTTGEDEEGGAEVEGGDESGRRS